MHCPLCNAVDTRVNDSRLVAEGAQVRRRRECTACGGRFTTYETAELSLPQVVKRDGVREAFQVEKLRSGLQRALEKRPVSTEALEEALARIQRDLCTRAEREVEARLIGELVMEQLKQLDQVAYIRFASVYRQFKDLEEFKAEIDQLAAQPDATS